MNKKKTYGISEFKEKPLLRNILILICIIVITILFALYLTNEEYRMNIDKYILKRELTENNLNSISLDKESIPYIYAYDKYITSLSKNSLSMYNEYGKEEFKLDVMISNPIMNSNNRFLVLAENNGQKLYLISGYNLLWQKDIEGNISKVNVNKNGYVTVIVTGTVYKSIVITYNPNGRELFRTVLSSTYALCTDISNDNKYLAIGEVDYSRTIVESNIKIISLDAAQNNPKQAIVYVYKSDSGRIINNIKYQEKDNVICMFDLYVQSVKVGSNETIMEFNNDVLFTDIDLKNNILKVEKQSSGLFSSEYQMKIINVNNGKESLYIMDGVPKNIKVYENKILVNLGTEVQIINTNGWLLKKYTSSQEIKDIVLSDNIVGIVYKDKIEIISL